MKLNSFKFGLAAAIVAFVATSIKSFFCVLTLNTITSQGYDLTGAKCFMASDAAKILAAPPSLSTYIGVCLVGIVAASATAFFLAWFFAIVYNKLLG